MNPVNSCIPNPPGPSFEEQMQLMMEHEENETIHRCGVILTRPAEENTEIKDIYLETDNIAWQNITCQKIMSRINIHRIIPVLPIVNEIGDLEPVNISYSNKDNGVVNTISFMNRTFRITVEEVI
jgi:hypothetical protein